ncbi:hypothetical protein LTR17_007468 [Elasticomyces elasticus]|nr:hypothetical protein LTR17_007468 [Elasticomyces elasticus]
MQRDVSILILGGGTFGLSTAYHLARAGYTKITVVEQSATVPPEQSAGNDLNKIIRAEYEDPFYADLALEAIEQWRQPLFAPYYREVGYLLATSPAAEEKAKATLQRSLRSISQHPAWEGKIRPIEKRSDISDVAPAFTGAMPWTGYYNSLAGYAHSADALTALYSACCALGVQIELGETIEHLRYEGSHCIGATTKSGKQYHATATIVTLGASVSAVLPSIAPQIKAVGFPLAHIQLSPEEAQRLRGLPVTYARDLGFFFEPDHRTHLLKVCSAGAGYTWFNASKTMSVPPAEPEDSAFIMDSDEAKMRELLRQSLPELADRPLLDKRICWCADSLDTDFVIDYVPGSEGLIVVSGDSGHAFKMLPIAGQWVKKVLEEGRQDVPRWKWKEVEMQGNEGVSWRVGTRKDLPELTQQRTVISKL